MAAFLALRERQNLAQVENAQENNVDESFMAQNEDQTIETSRAKQRKCRGQTKMDIVHTRRHEERKVIVLNDNFQPVSTDGKSTPELSNFLGTLARYYVPLDIIDWRKVPDKDNMWEFVKDKYIIPEEGKPWVMRTIRDAWRVYKSRIKEKHYSLYDNDEERIQHKPKDIPLEEFKTLLQYWADKKVQELAKKNAESRKKIIDTHTAGPRSFAQIRKKLQLEKPNQEEPSKAEIFIETRKRKEGRKYKSSSEILKYRLSTIEDLCSSGENNESVEQLICGHTTHGPSWLVGHRAIPRKSKEQSTKKISPSYVEEVTTEIKKES
ncbi:uncharacterized protein [Euphorbia lathyris]